LAEKVRSEDLGLDADCELAARDAAERQQLWAATVNCGGGVFTG
jgi:hypothetical protein